MRTFKALAVTFLLALSFWLIVRTSQVTHAITQKHFDPVAPPPIATLSRPVADIVTLGHKSVFDDFMHIWMLQIFTSKDIPKNDGARLFESIKMVADQQIGIESFYMLACFYMDSDMGRPGDCEYIALKGLQAFPQSWRIPMIMGFIYNFRLNDPVKAAAMYGIAASRQQSPPYVIRVAQKLINKESVSQDEISQTMEMMSQVPGGRSRFAEILQMRDSQANGEPQP